MKVHEKKRTYVYPDKSTLEFNKVTEVIISDSGSHRLKADGKLVWVGAGFRAIIIDEKEWTF